MHVFDPELSIKDNYLKADDLEYAAWQFAGEDHQRDHRNSANDQHRTAWLRSERLKLVREALIAGELLAFGVADSNPEAEIRPIPVSIFIASDLRMNDQEGAVSALGRAFREVKLCRANASELCTDNQIGETPPDASLGKAAKSGRKDTYPLSAMVLRKLFETPTNQHLSAEKLHPAFQEAFAAMHAGSNVPPPSQRTLRDQLNRFRQESAETGDNKNV